MTDHTDERPDRNLALEIVRVTEAAALAAARWVGRGDKNAADQAAVDAMRLMLDTVSMDGVVVIGEGEKDEAPMLYNGEQVGNGNGPAVDVAVDPIDGTRLTSIGQPNALSVVAVAERDSMFFPGAAVYMEKVAVGPDAVAAIDITASPAENVGRVARAKGVRPEDITVVILDRDRHVDLRARAAPDAFPVEEHRGLVLLALADHDDPVHRDGVEHEAHGVDGRLVGRLLVAPSDPARRRHRRRLGHAHELEREVAVGCAGVAQIVRDDARVSLGHLSLPPYGGY